MPANSHLIALRVTASDQVVSRQRSRPIEGRLLRLWHAKIVTLTLALTLLALLKGERMRPWPVGGAKGTDLSTSAS